MARRRPRQVEDGDSLIDDLVALTICVCRMVGLGLVHAIRWLAVRLFARRRPSRPIVVPPPALFPSSLRHPSPLPVAADELTSLHPVAKAEPLPYRRASRLLSKGEWAFWHPLYYAVRKRYRIFCKVRLADVVGVPGKRQQQRRWFKKIRGYHVDFVNCDPRTTAPLLVIELDDRSHATPRRRDRDLSKEHVLAAAGLPLMRVPVQAAYDPQRLRADIDRLICTTPRT